MSASVKIVMGLAVVAAVVAGAVLWIGQSDGPTTDGAAVSLVAADGGPRTELPDAVEGGRSRLTAADGPQGTPRAGVSAAGGQGEADGPDDAEALVARLLGRVVDEAGRPVPEARVVFHQADSVFLVGRDLAADELPAAPETTTDDDGRFALDVPMHARSRDRDLPGFAGEHADRLALVHPAIRTTLEDLPRLTAGDIELGDLVVARGAVVAGRLVDETGRAIAGATVTGSMVVRGSGGFAAMIAGNLAATHGRSTTGPDGRFVVTGLGQGEAELSARAPGRQQAWVTDLQLEAGLTEDVGDVLMLAGESIGGTVVDASGQPVEGAVVRVSSMTRLVVRSFDEAPPGRGALSDTMNKSARTDAQGWFELTGLQPGQYTVHAQHDNFARADRPNVATGTRDVRMVMARPGRLLVSVRDGATGAAVDGVELDARAAPAGDFVVMGAERLVVRTGREALDAAGLTDESPDGLYLVEGAGSAGTELELVADGYAASTLRAPGVPSGALGRFVVELSPESRLAGSVRDDAGRPVAGAVVSLTEFVPPQVAGEGGRFEVSREVIRRIGGDETPGVDWRRVETDDEGRFLFRSLPANAWELSARADGFAGSDEPVVELAEGEVRDGVLLSLRAGGDLAGVVLDADGEPVSGAEVRVAPVLAAPVGGAAGIPAGLLGMLGADGEGQRSARSDGAGRFGVEGLLPGEYDVSLARGSAMHLGGAAIMLEGLGGGAVAPTSERVAVVAGEETWVELVKPPTAGLRGRVTAAGRPVEGARVQLKQEDAFLPFGGPSAETDAYGEFVFEDVEPGRYEVSSLVDGAALAETVLVELEGGRDSRADLIFDGATVSGKVVDADTGEGVGGVTVNVIPVKSAQAAEPERRMAFAFVTAGPGGGASGLQMDLGGGSLSKVRSAPDGSFSVRFLDAGTYTFETQGGGYTKAQAGPVVLKDEREREGVVIEAVRGAVLSGLVTDGDTGQLLEGVPVSLMSMEGGGRPEMTVTENGSYRFEGLAAGEYAVTVMGSGFGGPPLASEVVALARGEQRVLDLATIDPGPAMPGAGMMWSGPGDEVEIEINLGGGH